MSTPTTPTLRIIPNGLETPRRARVVLLLLPGQRSMMDKWTLEDWPRRAHSLFERLLAPDEGGRVRLAAPADKAGTWPVDEESFATGRLVNPRPGVKLDLDRICRFWETAIAGGWSDLLSASDTDDKTKHSSLQPLPLPSAEAALLLPLERARHALEGIAPPSSPIHGRKPVRPPMISLAANGRPWLGKPDTLVRLAAASRNTRDDSAREPLLGPPDLYEWISAYRHGASDPEHPYSRPLDPKAIRAAALGGDDQDLLWLSDRMHALQHAALWTPAADPVSPEVSKGGGRRLYQLLSSPGLMRLFGWARDAWLDFDQPLPAQRQLVRVLPVYAQAVEEVVFGRVAADLDIARLGFYPATMEDRQRLIDGSPDTSDRAGALVLAGPGDPKYFATSVETVSAVEEDCQAVNALPEEKHPLARLVSGPLALTRVKRLPDVKPDGHDVFFAEHLAAPARMDVGVELDAKTIFWHPTSARVISHQDDSAKNGQDWPARTISALCPEWMPVQEREAAGVAQMEVVQTAAAVGNNAKDDRVAAYGGEDLGAPPNHPPLQATPGQRLLWQRQKTILGSDPALGDLLVGQRITTADGAELASLRFGWYYRLALRRAFWGGAGPPLDKARATYGEPGTVFPSLDEPAVRHLRQEPVAKPMVMLTPDSPWESGGNPQTAEQMYVGPDVPGKAKGQIVRRSSRILLPSAVPFSFAEQHDVFDPRDKGEPGEIRIALENPNASREVYGRADDPRAANADLPSPVMFTKDPQLFYRLAVKAPRQGLVLAVLEGELANPRIGNTKTLGDKLPRLRVRGVGEAREVRQAPYYPDPGAAFLVLRLAHPDRPSEWLTDERPLVIRIRNTHGVRSRGAATWPDVLPVRVNLVAVDVLGQQRLVDEGFTEEAGAVAVSGELEGVEPPRLQVRLVSVRLAPGEEAVLKAWFAPEASDLEAWFDVVHCTAGLCEAFGEKQGAAPADACRVGIASLLQRRAANNDRAIPELAEMFHQHLTREPLAGLAEVHTIRLTHSFGSPLFVASFVPNTARIARPASLEPEVLDAFLAHAGQVSSWPTALADDGATATVIGGVIDFDAATTSGLVVEALMRAPYSEQLDAVPHEVPAQLAPLDPLPLPFRLTKDGRADLEDPPSPQDARWVKVLAIKQIPFPPDARAKHRNLKLEEILAGKGADFEGAQVEFGAPLEQSQARQVLLRVIAVPRHSGRKGIAGPFAGPVWIPATARPARPDSKVVAPVFRWQEERRSADAGTMKVEGGRQVSLRLWLRRPWFTSGEGERLGIILWPPPAFSVGQDEQAQIPAELSTLAELQDSDLGPIGRFVSVWAHDPIEGFDARGGQHRFLNRQHFRDVANEMSWYPHVLVPLAGTDVDPSTGEASLEMSRRETNRETMAAVSLLSPIVRFAREVPDGKELPYVDLDLDLPDAASPRLRFGIVRLQPHARPDERRSGDKRQGIQCSAPEPVEIDLMPQRSYTLTVTRPGIRFGSPPDMTVVAVILRGPAGGLKEPDSRRRITIELSERRGNEGGLVPALALGDEVLKPARAVWGVGSTNNVAHDFQRGESSWTVTFSVPGDVVAERRDLAVSILEELVLSTSAGTPPAPDDPGLPRFAATVSLWDSK